MPRAIQIRIVVFKNFKFMQGPKFQVHCQNKNARQWNWESVTGHKMPWSGREEVRHAGSPMETFKVFWF